MNPDTPLQLLGGLTPREFLRDYWQQKPLLVRQAIPGFESPISADELAGLALEEEVESRLVLEHGARPWELRRGPFAEDTFSQLPERDWTLLVQAVDQFVPEVAEVLKHFGFLPSWRIDDLMISFAAPGGSVGPHFDNYDVFLLQAQGQRRWKIGQMCEADSRLLRARRPAHPGRLRADRRVGAGARRHALPAAAPGPLRHRRRRLHDLLGRLPRPQRRRGADPLHRLPRPVPARRGALQRRRHGSRSAIRTRSSKRPSTASRPC